jgi:hypothetical protein
MLDFVTGLVCGFLYISLKNVHLFEPIFLCVCACVYVRACVCVWVGWGHMLAFMHVKGLITLTDAISNKH